MYKHYKFKALKNYINIFGLFLVILSLTSCNSSIKKNANDKKETTDTIKTQIKQSDSTNNSDDIKSDFHQPKVNLTVEGFVNSLKAKERLSPFFLIIGHLLIMRIIDVKGRQMVNLLD